MRLAYMLAVFCMDSTVVVCAVSVMVVCFLSLFIVDYIRCVGSVQVIVCLGGAFWRGWGR